MAMVTLEMVVKPGSLDAVKQMLTARLPETRAYDGCRGITPYLQDDGRTILFVEFWDSTAHYEKYLAWRTETGVLEQLGSLLESEPTIRYFEALDS